MNTPSHEALVKEARRTAKERDKNAFQPKFDPESPSGHARGCRCRSVGCLKKYCECFNAGMRCGVNCGCQDCKNTEGHPELLRVLGVEPSVKRAKFGEDAAGASATHMMYPAGSSSTAASQGNSQPRTSAFDKSLERAALPPWLKAILITGPDRELIKVVSNPIMSNVLGITTTRRRTAAETLLDDYLTMVEYKDIAVQMATAARQTNEDVLTQLMAEEEEKKKMLGAEKTSEKDESEKGSPETEEPAENGAKPTEIETVVSAPSNASVVSVSNSSSTTNASTILSSSLELESPATKEPIEPSDSPFAYLMQPTHNLGNQPRLGLRDYEENAELLIDVAQEAVLLKILDTRLRLIAEKVIKNEEEKSRDKALKAAAKRREEGLSADEAEVEESPEHSPATMESSSSSTRITPPPEDRDTQPLEESGTTQPMDVDDS